MELKTICFKGVTILVVTLFLFPLAWSSSASVESAISEAQELFLKSKRKQAIESLNKFLLINSRLTQSQRNRILKTREKLETLFLKNETQLEYERGESFAFTKPDKAVLHFKKAHLLEPDHRFVTEALIAAYLRKEDCDSAETLLTENQWMMGTRGKLFELKLEVLLCLGKNAELNKVFTSMQSKENWSEVVWHKYFEYLSLAGGEMKIELEDRQKFNGLKISHPDSYFWLWRLDPKKGGESQRFIQKYKSICKNAKAEVRNRGQDRQIGCSYLDQIPKQELEGDKVEL